MADDISINIRTRGAKQSARETDQVGRSVRGLGRQARGASGGLRLFSRASTSAAGGMRLVTGAVATGGAAIGGALVLELTRATKAWEEKRQIIAQTQAVLKSTGGQAGVTAGQVDKLATSVSRSSGMDDEAVRDAENLLLTFRDVRNETGRGNDIFTQATRTTADLAAAMHMDLRQAALQVGKALNDPARGFARLQRIGVSFSKTQEDQIKHFSEVGDRAAAQRVILQELNKEFGGSAAKQVTPLKRLKVSWGNIEEAIGQGVSPAIDGVASSLDHLFVKAEPDLLKLNKRLTHLFERKDMDLGQKLQIGSRDVQRTLRPYEHELGAAIQRMHLGDQFETALEFAAPKIADAAGRAAPKAAGAFVHAFLDAGPYGKLFTVALLASKLGAFRTVGGMAAGKFYTGFATRFGPLLAAYLAVKIGQAVANLPTGVATGLNAQDTDPVVQRGRQMAGDPRNQAAAAEFNRLHPDYARRRAHQGLTARNLKTGLRLGDPSLIPGSPGVPSNYKPSVRAASGRGGDIVIHEHIHIDGKEVARTVHRHATDAKANRRGG